MLKRHKLVTWSKLWLSRHSYWWWWWPPKNNCFDRKFSAENQRENFRAENEEMYGYTGVSNKGGEVDLESGETLYPGLSYGENQLRWGFIRKVYGILAAQIVLTTLVSSVTVLYSPINDLLRGNSGLLLFLCVLPLICKSIISESQSNGRCFIFVNRFWIFFLWFLCG